MKCSFSLSSLSLLTFIVLAILKGCNVIAWDWLYVCIPLMVLGAVMLVYIIFIIIVAVVSAISERKRQ